MKEKNFNVIFIGSFLFPNGYAATQRKIQFLDYLNRQGAKTRVLLTLKWARGHELNDNKGVFNGTPYEAVGSFVKKNIFFPFTFIMMQILFCYKLWKYKENKVNNTIVSFSANYDKILVLLWAKLIGYKLVFDIVEDFSTLGYSGIKKRFAQLTHRLFIVKLADALSVISKHLDVKFSSFDIKCLIMRVPISASNLNLALDKKKTEGFNFLYSGTYGEKDGLDTLITAFKLHLNNYLESKLVMTGNCPPKIKDLIRKELGDFDNVILTGRLEEDNYYQTLQDADVLLMTRNDSGFANAGFPYKLGEYLATGNPVICSKVSDISDYLDDNAVFYFQPENVFELSEKMSYIISHYDDAKRVGEKGKKVCSLYFNPETNSAVFYSLIQSATNQQ